MDPSLCTPRLTFDQLPNPAGFSRQHSGVKRSFKKPAAFVAGLLLIMAAQSRIQAQELRYAVSGVQPDYAQGQTYSPSQQMLRPVQPLNAGQLEQLVAPIALYPDALVAQILAASTYPQQITDADGWRHEMANAPAEQVAAEADAQAWDPSVKALTAFPQVLAQMDRNLQWTTDLGNAYYNQPEDVLEAVQVMRARARDAGNLQSTPQETVSYNQGYIELAPANPQVVYVPAYNPRTTYGEPVTPYPGFNLLGVLGDIFGGTPLRYGLGIAMSAFTSTPWGWLAWGLNWLSHALLFDHSDYYSHSNTVADWGFRHSGFHAYGGHGGFGRSGFARSGMRGEGWRHDGYTGNSWHSFARGNSFAGSRSEWRSFAHGNANRENWRTASAGFQSFRGSRNPTGSYGRGFASSRSHYAANFNRAPARSVRQAGFGGWSSGRPSGSHFASAYGSSRGSSARTGHSGGLHLFGGGRSQKNFSGKNSGGFHSGSGHAPKGFGGGKSFGSRHSGGGHSGGGHSGGHGGSGHHR
jgi:hypothetical protein